MGSDRAERRKRQRRINDRVRHADQRIRKILACAPDTTDVPELSVEEILSILRVLVHASNRQRVAEACAAVQKENRP